MRLYSILTPQEFATLKDGQRLVRPLPDQDGFPAHALRWLAAEMEQRIGEPPEEAAGPLLSWQKALPNKKRPDLRRSGWAPSGSDQFLVTLEVEPEQVLSIEYQQWLLVQKGAYIARTFEEADDYRERLTAIIGAERAEAATPEVEFAQLPEELQEEITASWSRCLDVETPSELWEIPEHKQIRAATWGIEPDWIKKKRRFSAR